MGIKFAAKPTDATSAVCCRDTKRSGNSSFSAGVDSLAQKVGKAMGFGPFFWCLDKTFLCKDKKAREGSFPTLFRYFSRTLTAKGVLAATDVQREDCAASRSSSRSRLSSKVGEVDQVAFLHRSKRLEGASCVSDCTKCKEQDAVDHPLMLPTAVC